MNVPPSPFFAMEKKEIVLLLGLFIVVGGLVVARFLSGFVFWIFYLLAALPAVSLTIVSILSSYNLRGERGGVMRPWQYLVGETALVLLLFPKHMVVGVIVAALYLFLNLVETLWYSTREAKRSTFIKKEEIKEQIGNTYPLDKTAKIVRLWTEETQGNMYQFNAEVEHTTTSGKRFSWYSGRVTHHWKEFRVTSTVKRHKELDATRANEEKIEETRKKLHLVK